jgi:hypothetical protein
LLSLCRARILELEPQQGKESALELVGFGAASVPSRSVSPG